MCVNLARLKAARASRSAVILGCATNLAVLAIAFRGLAGLAAAVLVALACGYSIALRPQRGILLLVLLAPFSGLLLVIPHPGMVTAWKEALVIITLLGTFIAPSSARGAAGRPLPGWTTAVLGWLAVGVFSALLVGGLQSVIGLKITFFYGLAAIAVWRCPLSEKERDLFVSTIMATGIITAGYGVVQQLLGAARLNSFGYEYNSTIRFAGSFLRSFSTFNQPFPFGFYVAFSLLIGIPQVLSDPRRRRNQLFLLATPVLVLGLVFSFVRGAWLFLAIGLAYLGWRQYRALVLVLVVAVLGIAFLPAKVSDRAFSSGSTQARSAGWTEHLHDVAMNPFGIGIGATGSSALKSGALRGDKAAVVYEADNYYFKTLLELGVMGLWLFSLVLISAFGAVRAAEHRLTGSAVVLAQGTSAMLAGAAGASAVATYFEIFPMDVMFWVTIAVVASCSTE
jgi:hypothetical protein